MRRDLARAAAILVGCLLGLLPFAAARAQYAASDSIWWTFCFRDSTGYAVAPDSARAFVYKGLSLIDTTITKATMTALGTRRPVWYGFKTTLPADATPKDYSAWVRCSGDGFIDDWVQASPQNARIGSTIAVTDSVRSIASAVLVDSVRAVGTIPAVPSVALVDSVRTVAYAVLTDSVRAVGSISGATIDSVRAVGYVDSLGASALTLLWPGTSSTGVAVLDSSSCTPCGIYSGGSPVSGATVYITSGTPITATNILNYGTSVSGQWSIPVPEITGVADTVYVWAWYQRSFSLTGTQVIVSE